MRKYGVDNIKEKKSIKEIYVIDTEKLVKCRSLTTVFYLQSSTSDVRGVTNFEAADYAVTNYAT